MMIMMIQTEKRFFSFFFLECRNACVYSLLITHSLTRALTHAKCFNKFLVSSTIFSFFWSFLFCFCCCFCFCSYANAIQADECLHLNAERNKRKETETRNMVIEYSNVALPQSSAAAAIIMC